MATFEIRYIKRLCDDAGHEHDACQSLVKVEAASACEALQLAEHQACASHRLADWTMFADTIELRAITPLGGEQR